MKYWYRVKYGFKPSECVAIQAGPDLERAIYAKIEKIPVTLGGKFIDGNTILRIEPYVHKYTGWYDSYEPKDGDDEAQIKRDCPKELEPILEKHTEFVMSLIRNEQPQLIGSGQALTMELPGRTEVSRLTDGLANKMKQLHGTN
jgi:hypothetical protein